MIETNKHGTNAKFIYQVFSDAKMRELGFTDYDLKHWYFCKTIAGDITFNLTILKRWFRWMD